jgi:hypothetical protein
MLTNERGLLSAFLVKGAGIAPFPPISEKNLSKVCVNCSTHDAFIIPYQGFTKRPYVHKSTSKRASFGQYFGWRHVDLNRANALNPIL